MPRATTAAWEVMPPRVVRMPSAACMPWMSSGEVSTRTRITFLPSALSLVASSELNTISPEAAPGEAGRPVAQRLVGGRVDLVHADRADHVGDLGQGAVDCHQLAVEIGRASCRERG